VSLEFLDHSPLVSALDRDDLLTSPRQRNHSYRFLSLR
jgi:hypothetical protein